MARGVKEGPNRSQFIRDKLKENKKVSYKEVAAAWQKLGHPEEIKATLFYLVKNKAKGGKYKGRERASVAVEASVVTDANAELLDIERALDRLVAAASLLREPKLAEDLRVARRRVSSLLV